MQMLLLHATAATYPDKVISTPQCDNKLYIPTLVQVNRWSTVALGNSH
jgi:hypothetical protein